MVPKATPMGAFVSLAALVLALVAACTIGGPDRRPAPTPLNLYTVAACPIEDGPGSGPVPCVWDYATRGHVANPTPYEGIRWVLYVAGDTDACPVVTVQPATEVHCVPEVDWSGGIS